MWYVILLVPSISGLWLAAKHWYGWAISSVSEVCWAAYSLRIGARPLLVMSGIWFAVHSRNCWVTYRAQRNGRALLATLNPPAVSAYYGGSVPLVRKNLNLDTEVDENGVWVWKEYRG